MAVKETWAAEQTPNQEGRVAIITGANSGVGLETARVLAGRGAIVILACRSAERAEAAVLNIKQSHPEAVVSHSLIDLADLQSTRDFATRIHDELGRLDLLINNAGVMVPRKRVPTKDGFELQIGVNHLGHFALTGLLLDLLVKTPQSRVVTVSSQAHRHSKMQFRDLNWNERRYKRYAAYSQSKLANLLFTAELNRRLQAQDSIAVASHPGWTSTDLQRNIPGGMFFNKALAMTPKDGALPSLRAALDTSVKGGDYFGPGGLYEMRGMPVRVESSKQARSLVDAERLWRMSTQLTGVDYDEF